LEKLPDIKQGIKNQTIALIAHDSTKRDMMEFAETHFRLLATFAARRTKG